MILSFAGGRCWGFPCLLAHFSIGDRRHCLRHMAQAKAREPGARFRWQGRVRGDRPRTSIRLFAYKICRKYPFLLSVWSLKADPNCSTASDYSEKSDLWLQST